MSCLSAIFVRFSTEIQDSMRDFFRGWRRKTGCLTLVIASVPSTIWIHSLSYDSKVWVVFNGRLHTLTTHHGTLIWRGQIAKPRDASDWILRPTPRYWVELVDPWYFDSERWNVSIPPIAITLTIFSAFLLLWPQRQRPNQSNPQSLR